MSEVKKAPAKKPATAVKAPAKKPTTAAKKPAVAKAPAKPVAKKPTVAAAKKAAVAKKVVAKPAAKPVAKTEAAPKPVIVQKPVAPEGRNDRKVRMGKVVSDKMDKTIVVLVVEKKPHPLYKKTVTRSKRFKAHDENNECGIGDTVEIMETRPLSKHKHFRLLRVIEKAK